MPESEREIVNPVTLPASVIEYVAAMAEWRDVEGLYGVTQVRNGRSAAKAVKAVWGVESGIAARNGDNKDGVD
jgi:hypothetical protein